jgi:AraC family transcriptional regulator of adaptative response/methylated-DNA-[protein]-cysteine methyltransferase
MLAMTAAEPAVTETDDDRYAAFVARDRARRADFVMAVKTTGVYCRAGCPARTPLRKNVLFFDGPAEARAAGFRACRRCRPDESRTAAAAIVARACETIENARTFRTVRTAFSCDALAREAGLSKFHFHRLFKAETGVTPAAYAAAVGDRLAKAALQAGAGVTEAVYDAGYGSAARFYDGAESRFGMAPKRWRAGGAGERIRVAVAPCSLGLALVAATDKGLCAVRFGDDAETLVAEFRAQFAAAEVADDDPEFAELVAAVVAAVDHDPRRAADLPLDVRGTAFQHRVWDALRRIPAGEAWTYARLAEAIGAPKAVRAVGAACGANTVAVVIPCHRVVGSDGKLTGYRWGVARKRALLDRERGG